MYQIAVEVDMRTAIMSHFVQLRIAAYGSLLTTMFFGTFFHRKGPVK